ncbi:MAG: amino acid ABC transporter substrate-binding protein, partial [Bacteroidetes bacterium]|nr:amino acid ABC transporter substrate-binding protein [Bacteroidota bacterium]
MKKYLRGIYAVIFFLSIASTSFAEETIRITNGEWAPYLSKHLKYYGLGSRIVKEAFALEGVKVEYGFFPWGRAYDLASHGEWDGSILYSRNPERENKFYITNPVAPSKYVFFHLKSFNFNWNTLDDLKNIVIGTGEGYGFGSEFEKAEKEGRIDVQRVPTDEMNVKKLMLGRIKLYPQDVVVGYDLINKMVSHTESQKITYHPKPLLEKPQHLLLSKKIKRNKRMLNLFNKGLQRLKDSGKYNQYF